MRSPLSNIANTVGSFFNRSAVSSSVFTGQGADNSQQFVAQTQQFIQNQNQTQQVLTTVQQQIIGLQQQVQALSQGLEKVATLLQQDTAQEQSLLNAEEENKRKNLIQKTRTDRESAIETAIETALITPVQRATEKVQGFFGRIGEALKIMFMGFLGVQALKFLKALKEGDEKTMGEIKDLVLKNITYALGAFAAWKLGLPLLNQALKGMVGKVKDIVLGGLKSIFTNAFNAIKNMLSGLKPPSISGGGPKPPSAASTKPPTGAAPEPEAPKGGKPPAGAAPEPEAPKGGKPPAGAAPDAVKPKGGKPPVSAAPGTGIGSRLARLGGRLLAPITGALSFFGRKEEGQSNVQAGSGALAEMGGASAGASAAATAASPLLAGGPIGWGAYGLSVLGGGVLGGLGAGRVSDYFTGAGEENRQEGQKATLNGNPVVWSKEKNDWIPDPDAPQPAQVTPTQTMTGESLSQQKEKTSEPTAAPEQAKVTPTETMTGQQVSDEKLKEPSNNNAPFVGKPDSKSSESSTKEDSKSSPAQMSAPSEQTLVSGVPGAPNAFDISTLPVSAMSPTQDRIKNAGMIPPIEEPPTNVIVNTIPVGQEGPPSGTPSSSDVPHINSSNSDNFYVLYSKLNYNVVV